jgi:hypothetical protein
MARKTSAVGAIALIALTVIVAAGAVSASAARNDVVHSSAHALVGSWDVTLTLPGLPPGRVLATFDGDGGTVESANAAPALRGASHGAWERIEPNLFAVTRVFFRFNPQTGAYLGTQKVNATVRVAAEAKRSPLCRSRSYATRPETSFSRVCAERQSEPGCRSNRSRISRRAVDSND